MIDRDSFLDLIAADPCNDGAWLVYADWLEEQGECDTAELIRSQIEAGIMYHHHCLHCFDCSYCWSVPREAVEHRLKIARKIRQKSRKQQGAA